VSGPRCGDASSASMATTRTACVTARTHIAHDDGWGGLRTTSWSTRLTSATLEPFASSE
jgi:hypothetical protein